MKDKYSYQRAHDKLFYFWEILRDGIVIGQLYLRGEDKIKAFILDLNMACDHDWHDGDPWGRGNSDNYVCGNCGAAVKKSDLDAPSYVEPDY